LNNLIEQDHRSIKLRLGPMLGFKRFRRAATTIAGIELMHRIRRVNSNSANFASKTKPRLRFGMQCLARDPRQAPERFLAPISSICTSRFGQVIQTSDAPLVEAIGPLAKRRLCPGESRSTAHGIPYCWSALTTPKPNLLIGRSHGGRNALHKHAVTGAKPSGRHGVLSLSADLFRHIGSSRIGPTKAPRNASSM
jgi:DDE domain